MNGFNKSLASIHKENNGKVSDKWEIYLDVYNRVFEHYRDKNINFLEIGIQNGGSLEVWSEFFKNAKNIIGCDIDKKCSELRYSNSVINVIVGDATQSTTKNEILKKIDVFDIVIEDASHKSCDIIKAFIDFFPYLNDGGIFVVEDIHCSYWKEWEGGLYDPFSSISFFKLLIDVINHEHWGNNKTIASYLNGFIEKYNLTISIESLLHIHSIEFVNSMCIIKKNSSNKNILGRRIVSGKEAIVSEEPFSVNNSFQNVPDQSHNFWAILNIDPREEYLILQEKIQEKDRQIQHLQKLAESMRIKNRIKRLFGMYK